MDDINKLLLSYIKECPILYDPKFIRITRIQDKTNKILNEIAEVINHDFKGENLNLESIKTRWTSMKKSYSRWLKKENSEYTSFYLADEMEFLKPFMNVKKKYQTMMMIILKMLLMWIHN